MTFFYTAYFDENDLPMWACHREGSGIAGHGLTPTAAREDFLDKENELVPIRPSRVIHSSAFEPPTYADDRRDDPDEEHV